MLAFNILKIIHYISIHLSFKCIYVTQKVFIFMKRNVQEIRNLSTIVSIWMWHNKYEESKGEQPHKCKFFHLENNTIQTLSSLRKYQQKIEKSFSLCITNYFNLNFVLSMSHPARPKSINSFCYSPYLGSIRGLRTISLKQI